MRPLVVSMLVFALLAGTAFFVLRRPRDAEPGPFFALARPTPDTLTVLYGPDTTVVVPGGRTGWRVIAPVEDVADGVVIDALVERLRDLEVARRFPLDPARLDTYGFRLTRGKVRAAYAGGTPPDTLVVGSFTMDAGHDYVRDGSRDEVGLLESRITRSFVLKRTRDLRDTRFFPFHESRAVWFRGRDAAGRVVSEGRRDTTGAWVIASGYPGPADTRKVNEFLSSVAHMHIDSFADETRPPGPETGLDRPRAVFEVALETGDTLRGALGDPVPGEDLMLAETSGRPQLLRVSTKYLPVFLTDIGKYRDPVVLPFGLGGVDSVEADFGGAGRAVWTSGEWGRVENPGPRLREALEWWITARAEGFREAAPAELAAFGLDDPLGRLRWWGGGRLLAELQLGRTARDGRLPVRRAGGTRPRDGEILLLPLGPAGGALEVLSAGRLKLQPRD